MAREWLRSVRTTANAGNDQPAGNDGLRYGTCPTLAGVLRTYLVTEDGSSWRDHWAAYAASDPASRLALITDLDAMLADHAASEEQVQLWVRAHTSSPDGLIEPGVPVRHSLLALRDAALDDVRRRRGS